MDCAYRPSVRIRQEVWAMESPKRKKERIPKVERSFERSRVEGQLMALAYEQVLPVVRARTASLSGMGKSEVALNVPPRRAAGA
jgi:hypothetical protein